MSQSVKFPLAKPNIEDVLEQFLDDKREQLKPSTIRKYENIINLFKHSLNGYAYQALDKAETELFDQLYNAEGNAHREFVEVFGPEKIPGNVGEFLRYFMPRKVMCGKETLKSAATVMKTLGKWLAEHGYVGDECPNKMIELGKEASTELPAAEELAKMLYEYAEEHVVSDWTDEVDDYFTVDKIEPGKLYFSDDNIVLKLPKRITDKCKVGWNIGLFLGKTKKGWQMIEVGQVYAM